MTNYIDKSLIFDQINNLLELEEYDSVVVFLLKLHPADLADFLDQISNRNRQYIIPLIINDIQSEVLIELNTSTLLDIIQNIVEYKQFIDLLNKLNIEDIVEILEKLPTDLVNELILLFDSDKKYHINIRLTYPDHSAGRIMEKDFIILFPNWTVSQAINMVRKNKLGKEFHVLIVVNNRNCPIGQITLQQLLRAHKDEIIKNIMTKGFIRTANTYTNLDELVYIFKQYALTIIPVVNRVEKLVGVISIDHMVYIVSDQAEEDMMQLAGIRYIEIPTNLLTVAKYRFPWLFVNLIATCLSSLVIREFNDVIVKLIALASVMPIVSSMSGNAGTQVMVGTIRALINKDIPNLNLVSKLVAKEVLICGLNGFILACLGGIVTLGFYDIPVLSFIFFISVTINFIIAGLFGSLIPIFLVWCRADPATASGILLTTMTDLCGFFTFLGLAYFLV